MDQFLTPQVTLIAVGVLVVFSVGALIYAFLEPLLSGSSKVDKRISSITAERISGSRGNEKDADKRRKSVQEQLKEFEEKQKAKAKRAKRQSLSVQIAQSGLGWDRKKLIVFSVISGFVFLILGFLMSRSLLPSLGFLFVGALGFPRWYISFKRKRRLNAFVQELPNAMDIIVRGVRAGLPLADCVRIVGAEAREPVATEFRRITEGQAMGRSLSESVARLPDRVPLPEANFFAIVVSIQQQAGGSLSEALANLSNVLRQRKSMKGKIKAMSSEAKSSAMIIGSLPFIVAGLVALVSPDYLMLLFTESTGHLILLGSGIWMGLGILMMRKMINFDF